MHSYTLYLQHDQEWIFLKTQYSFLQTRNLFHRVPGNLGLMDQANRILLPKDSIDDKPISMTCNPRNNIFGGIMRPTCRRWGILKSEKYRHCRNISFSNPNTKRLDIHILSYFFTVLRIWRGDFEIWKRKYVLWNIETLGVMVWTTIVYA